jgi:oxygen-independent coproporphyrinogen-3 oxidase
MPGLYLHIPFCEHKCAYCDFYSLEDQSSQQAFVDTLLIELERQAPLGADATFDTVFFGGGTPSLLTPEQLTVLLDRLRSLYALADGAEITLEANPGTIEMERVAAFRVAGVNRLSIGIQSFHDDDLRFLERIHDRAQAMRAVEMARGAGFDNVNIDLIFALPGQTMERWEENVRTAVGLAPDHVAAYGLIVEEHTPLSHRVRTGSVIPAGVETEAGQFERTMIMLREAGFEQYEVSNYAKPGKRSRHNLNYWHHGTYLGFGPSAHSFWTVEGVPRRWWNAPHLPTYLRKIAEGSTPIAAEEELTPRDVVNERIFLGLRSDGLDVRSLEEWGDRFEERAGEILRGLVDRDLLMVDGHRYRLTSAGYLLCDEIAERLFLP